MADSFDDIIRSRARAARDEVEATVDTSAGASELASSTATTVRPSSAAAPSRRRGLAIAGSIAAVSVAVVGGIVLTQDDGSIVTTTPSTDAIATTVPTTPVTSEERTSSASSTTVGSAVITESTTTVTNTTLPTDSSSTTPADVSYLAPPPELALEHLGVLPYPPARMSSLNAAIGDLGVAVRTWDDTTGTTHVVAFDGSVREFEDVDGYPFAYGPGDVLYTAGSLGRMQALALTESGAVEVLVSQPTPVNEFNEIPEVSFVHGQTAVISQRTGGAVISYVDTAGEPTVLPEAAPRFTATIDRVESEGLSWPIRVESHPTRTSTYTGGSSPAPTVGGAGVFWTHIGPNLRPEQDYGEPSMWVIAHLQRSGDVTWWSVPDGWEVVASDIWGTVLARHVGGLIELALADFDAVPAGDHQTAAEALSGITWVATTLNDEPYPYSLLPTMQFSAFEQPLVVGFDGCAGYHASGSLELSQDSQTLRDVSVAARSIQCESTPVVLPMNGDRIDRSGDRDTFRLDHPDRSVDFVDYASLPRVSADQILGRWMVLTSAGADEIVFDRSDHIAVLTVSTGECSFVVHLSSSQLNGPNASDTVPCRGAVEVKASAELLNALNQTVDVRRLGNDLVIRSTNGSVMRLLRSLAQRPLDPCTAGMVTEPTEALMAEIVEARRDRGKVGELIPDCAPVAPAEFGDLPPNCWSSCDRWTQTIAEREYRVDESFNPSTKEKFLSFSFAVTYRTEAAALDTTESWIYRSTPKGWVLDSVNFDDPPYSRREAADTLNEYLGYVADENWLAAAEMLNDGGLNLDERLDLARLGLSGYTNDDLAAGLEAWCADGCRTEPIDRLDLEWDGLYGTPDPTPTTSTDAPPRLEVAWYEGALYIIGLPFPT